MVVVVGAVAGIPAGIAVVLGARVLRAQLPVEASSTRPRHELGGAVAILVVLAAMAGIVTSSRAEPGSVGQTRVAANSIVAADRLPGGWSRDGVIDVDRGDELDDNHLCNGDPSMLPSFDAAVHQRFTRPGPGSSGDETLQIGVYLAADPASARHEVALAKLPAHLDCTRDNVEQMLYVDDATGPRSSTGVVHTSEVPSVPDVLEVTAHQPTRTGLGWINVSYVRMQVGRAVLRISAITFGRPFDVAELVRIAQTEATHLEEELR
jgi:hypothetical protein